MKLTKERLIELKRITEVNCFNFGMDATDPYYAGILTVLKEAISSATQDKGGGMELKNNFERWKAELTIDYLSQHEIILCVFCPAQTYCGTQPESKGCGTIVKEWGEQDA